jgi:hypothetical protein
VLSWTLHRGGHTILAEIHEIDGLGLELRYRRNGGKPFVWMRFRTGIELLREAAIERVSALEALGWSDVKVLPIARLARIKLDHYPGIGAEIVLTVDSSGGARGCSAYTNSRNWSARLRTLGRRSRRTGGPHMP